MRPIIGDPRLEKRKTQAEDCLTSAVQTLMGRRKKNLIPVKVGDTIGMRLLEEKKWSLGHCTCHPGSSLPYLLE